MVFVGLNPRIATCGYIFVCCLSLSFKSSLHQRFTMRPNGCRESCSGVNCSVSARLEPADGVACSSACQVAFNFSCSTFSQMFPTLFKLREICLFIRGDTAFHLVSCHQVTAIRVMNDVSKRDKR